MKSRLQPIAQCLLGEVPLYEPLREPSCDRFWGMCGRGCRSELARDGLRGDAFTQRAGVIVNVHREQARLLQGLFYGVDRDAEGVFAVQELQENYDAFGTVAGQENRFQFLIAAAVDAHPVTGFECCLLYTSPSPRDGLLSRMPSSA